MQHVVRLCAALGWGALCSVSIPAADIALVNHTNVWLYHKGTNAPHPDWTFTEDVELEPTDWASGAGGFGYADNVNETNQCRTILSDMRSRGYTTVYTRRAFNVTGVIDSNYRLYLTMDWDDGFAAWLDGSYLTSANWNSAPAEPAYTDRSSGTHESSRGNNSPQPAVTYDLGLVGNRLAPGPHVLAIVGLNDTPTSSDFILIADLSAGPFSCPPNTLCSDTNWTVANSPYVISANLTVASGVTLTIDPGVTVLFNQGVGLTVNGRILAEGTPTGRIRFARNTGASSWSRILIQNNTSESRFAYCDIDGAASTGNITANYTDVYLDHVIFTNTTAQLVTLDDASCIIQHCHFPSIQGNELLHFLRMPPNGHALLLSNVFGTPGIPATSGYNDIIDFTGGNRPGPIVQFIGNVFLSCVDDCFDMDGTDAHIEGNVFINVKQDAQRDSSSSPITTGGDDLGLGNTSQLVVCRNIIYDSEHALMLKDHGTALVQNNTFARLVTNALARTGSGSPIPPGPILFGEPWRGSPLGDGAIWEGNIAWDLATAIQANPFPYFNPAVSFLTVNQSLIQGTNWPGTGNLAADPLFVNPANVNHTNIWSSLALQPGSPCLGTGPNGLDMGAVVPAGASISGAPEGTTTNTSATLRIAGPGIFAYKWRLNGGPWSAEIPLTTNLIFTASMFANARPLVLTNLADGIHTVEVIGRNSAGFWQSTNRPAARTWTVNTAAELRILGCHRADDSVTLSFEAVAGQSYSALYSDSLHPAHWIKFHDLAPPPVTSVQVVADTNATTAVRFYRIVTPAQP